MPASTSLICRNYAASSSARTQQIMNPVLHPSTECVLLPLDKEKSVPGHNVNTSEVFTSGLAVDFAFKSWHCRFQFRKPWTDRSSPRCLRGDDGRAPQQSTNDPRAAWVASGADAAKQCRLKCPQVIHQTESRCAESSYQLPAVVIGLISLVLRSATVSVFLSARESSTRAIHSGSRSSR